MEKYQEINFLEGITLQKKKCCMTSFQNEKRYFSFWKMSCHCQKVSVNFFFMSFDNAQGGKTTKKDNFFLADVKSQRFDSNQKCIDSQIRVTVKYFENLINFHTTSLLISILINNWNDFLISSGFFERM